MGKRLSDLEPAFIRGTALGWVLTDSLATAEGVLFDCPGCGEHKVLVWRVGVPHRNEDGPRPNPPRWTMTGTGLADLTLSPSVDLLSGCMWHGFVRSGVIVDAG